MAERVTIAELNIDIDSVIKDGGELLKVINDIKAQQKELDRTTVDGATAYAKLDAQLKNVQTQYRDNRKFAQTLLAVNKDLEATISAEGKSVQQLNRDRGKLIALSREIRGDTEEEREIRKRLNDAIDAQTEALREQSSQYIQGKDSVGEYRQAILDTIPANTFFGRTIGNVQSALQVVTPLYNAFRTSVKTSVGEVRAAAAATEGLSRAQKVAAVATNIGSAALKIFRAALISTGIGAIVVALGSLVAFLGSTQRGIDAVNQVLKPLGVIFDRLFGVIQRFGEAIFDAFSNPKQLISDLADAIKQNLITRFEALQRIIQRVLDFDFKGIGEDLSQAATGVENIGEKTRNFFSQANDFIRESIALGQQLADLQVSIERGEINLITRQAELNREIKEQNLIAEDINRTLAEREAAAERSLAANQELLKLEQEQLDLKIKQAEIEFSLNDTSREDEKELAQLKAERIEAETRALELQTTQNNKLNQIRREASQRAIDAAKAEQAAAREAANEAVRAAQVELEIFKLTNKEKLEADGELNRARIDAALGAEMFIKDESIRLINEKVAAGILTEQEGNLERLKIQEDFNARRAELEQEFADQQKERQDKLREEQKEREQVELEAERELEIARAEDRFQRQLVQLEQRRQAEVAAAEKIGADTAAIEARYAEQRKQIEQAVAENKLQALSGVFASAAGLFKEQTALSKVLGIAQATIDTYIGANKALATLPPPLGAIQAGITIGTGLANVAKISGVPVFEKGGAFIAGGKRHSAGGTKYYGEDGSAFEAERGEYIGVMSRQATSAFLAFNKRFTTGGQSRSGYYQGGGVFSGAGLTTASRFGRLSEAQGIDYDRLAVAVKDGYQAAAPPQVAVNEINTVANAVAEVEISATI